MRRLLVRLLLGGDIAEMLRGYRPPRGKHNSLITGSPTNWSWGKGDHGSELDGLLDDDHTQYLNNARHDVVARHPSTVIGVARGEELVMTDKDFATGLNTVVSAVAVLGYEPDMEAMWVSVHNSVTPGNMVIKVWKPMAFNDVTPVPNTEPVIVKWVAVGT